MEENGLQTDCELIWVKIIFAGNNFFMSAPCTDPLVKTQGLWKNWIKF